MITTVMLTAYLTVYDGLSPWYRAAVRVQKPRRNELSLGLQTSLDGFRGRVSQVRILPGPLHDFIGFNFLMPALRLALAHRSGEPHLAGAFANPLHLNIT